MIDFHSHVLPEMDDGSGSVQESLQMLKLSWKMGVDTIVATPHYYAEDESIENFIDRRREKNEMLMRFLEGERDIPQIILGAETAFFSGIGREKNISKLCIGGTKYLLLEMPFAEWTSLTLKEIRGLTANRGIIPIIAHVDRYVPVHLRNGNVKELLNLGAVVQVNGDALTKGSHKRMIMKMISKNEAHLLGSDCHNMNENPPNLDFACKQISGRLGESRLRKIDEMGRSVLEGDFIR